MSNYCLNLLVNGGTISSGESRLTADSVAYVTTAFTFDESWDALYKTAVFRVGEVVYHMPLEQDQCTIPHEALQDGLLYISVFGVWGNTRATTTELPILVEKSGYIACEPTAPSPDPYAYYLEQASALKEQAVSAAERSEAASVEIQDLTDTATTAMEQAAASAKLAEEHCNTTLAAAETATAAIEQIHEAEANVVQNASDAKQAATDAIDAGEAAKTVVLTSIETHNAEQNELAHPQLKQLAEEAKSIALGKANSLCFDTLEQMDLWLLGEYARPDGKTPADLKVGDNLYIVELGVPDYWWDGAAAQPLGAEQPDLTDYYTKSQIDSRIGNTTLSTMSRTDYDAAYALGTLDAGRIYFVYEEESQ